ncbi:CRISPR-associated protein Cas4 [Candidatus Woesearchaeota archaeon]|nr:MAG: CRISPR-associated protein Cas4 [Candidatus Woesearchaeota archaeon]
MFNDSELLPISSLNHYIYCKRRCALVHLEQIWVENRFTAEGQALHERVDSNKTDQTGGVRIVRTLPICSSRLGLSGQADVVEFHRDGMVFPVEYKRGRPKKDRCDEVQLCAQAICLEEMLEVDVPTGALFYGQRRRRKTVEFDCELRQLVENIARQVHELFKSGITPLAEYSKKCDNCSLLQNCMPKSCRKNLSVRHYMTRMLKETE